MALISPYANKKKHNKQLNQHLNELAEFLRFTIEIRPNEFLFASSLLSHIFRSTEERGNVVALPAQSSLQFGVLFTKHTF